MEHPWAPWAGNAPPGWTVATFSSLSKLGQAWCMCEETISHSSAICRTLKGHGARGFKAGHEEGTQSRDRIRSGRTVTRWDKEEGGHDGTNGTPTGSVSGTEGWEQVATQREVAGTCGGGSNGWGG